MYQLRKWIYVIDKIKMNYHCELFDLISIISVFRADKLFVDIALQTDADYTSSCVDVGDVIEFFKVSIHLSIYEYKVFLFLVGYPLRIKELVFKIHQLH